MGAGPTVPVVAAARCLTRISRWDFEIESELTQNWSKRPEFLWKILIQIFCSPKDLKSRKVPCLEFIYYSCRHRSLQIMQIVRSPFFPLQLMISVFSHSLTASKNTTLKGHASCLRDCPSSHKAAIHAKFIR